MGPARTRTIHETIIVVVYILMNVSYLTALSPQKLANSTVVGVDWADEVLGSSWSWIIPICVSICAFGTLHASLFANGRQAYAASREGHLPEVISYVNKYTLTPTPGLLFTGSLGIIFILMKDIDALLNMFMVAMTFFYGLSMLALIVALSENPFHTHDFAIACCVIARPHCKSGYVADELAFNASGGT